MPNNPTQDEAELSRLLSQAEPPESPEHLDDFILQYAKEKAPARQAAAGFQFLSWQWLGQHWISAVATLSIAFIAVSVSLQTFNTPVMEQSTFNPETDLASISLTDSSAAGAAAPADSAEPAEARLNRSLAFSTAADNTPTTDQPGRERQQSAAAPASSAQFAEIAQASTNQTSDRDQNALRAEQASPALAATDAATALADSQIASASAASPAVQTVGDAASRIDSAAAGAVVEEELANATFRRTAQSVNATSELAESASLQITLEPQNLPQFLSLLEQVLTAADQGQRELADEAVDLQQRAARLIVLFDNLPGSDSVAAAENDYAQSRSGITEFALPEALAAAIEILRSYDFQ